MGFRTILAVATLTLSCVACAPGLTWADRLPQELVPGQQVKVEGASSADGWFHASQVTLRDVEGIAKVEGLIDFATSDHKRLRVVGFDVVVDAATRLYRGSQLSTSRSILRRGAWVEARGTWKDGAIKATRLRLKDAPEVTEEIEGVIQSADLTTSTVVVLNRRIVIPKDAAFLDERTGRLASIDQSARLRRDDDDSPGRQPLTFGNVVVGGRVEGGYLDEQNFAIGERHADRTVISRTQIIAASRITDSVEAYTKVSLSRNVPIGGEGQVDARVSEAYLLFHDVAGRPIDLQVGRQRFRDAREWFADEYLDAVRVHARVSRVTFEAAVSQGVLAGPQATRARRDQFQLVGSAGTTVGGARVAFRAMERRDLTRGERPVWLAASIDGAAGQRWHYWTDMSLRRGRAGTTRLRGWAVDSGVRHTWSRPGSPTMSVGYAHGSGDSHKTDGIDTRFRQTDLEDNQAYFGGLRRVAIYGELFDPELTNLQVMTVGLGARPRRALGIDAVYHEYIQSTVSSSLPSGNLDGDLTGAHRAIGRELDVVVTLRAFPGFDIDLAAGVFVPGRAFGTTARSAFFWRPQMRFYF